MRHKGHFIQPKLTLNEGKNRKLEVSTIGGPNSNDHVALSDVEVVKLPIRVNPKSLIR